MSKKLIKQIFIKDYILIDELLVEFDKGLNVITGETGAGKSILINAIDIAFGAKVSKEVIKTGKERASIEITLKNTHDLSLLFEENGVDNFGDEIILSKEITQTGSRSRVNGTLVNQDFIKTLKENFLDIHSQHQTYSFLQPKYHITLLDNYAKDLYGCDLQEYRELYKNYQNLQAQLEVAKNSAGVTASQIEFLKFQIDEIESAQIENINEDEELKNELSILQNVEKLKELSGASYWALNNDDNSIITALGQIRQNISKASKIDENLEEIEGNLIEASEMLSAISSHLRDYSQNLENDTQKLNDIQERIFLLDKLKRKYGGTLENVLTSLEGLVKEFEQIEFSTQNVENLEIEISATLAQLNKIAKDISEKRKDYAQVLSVLIVEKLEKLELPKVKFEISVTPCALNQDGADKVEFLISTNVSEGLKPLAKVASGGEVSRVMLAIKTIFANNDEIDTVIFDEIDTGISGKTSQSVADEILELANSHQIILITHQAIIASKAQKHFYVAKKQDETTSVNIYTLTGENKIMALAELAGGEINDQSMDFAKSLLA